MSSENEQKSDQAEITKRVRQSTEKVLNEELDDIIQKIISNKLKVQFSPHIEHSVAAEM